MGLLLSFQAEGGTLSSGASLITDADCTPSGSNNAVQINAGPENMSYNFGTVPVGTTKFRIFVKKQTLGISDATININLIGSGSPQYSIGAATLAAEGLHYLEFTNLPTAGNNEMNIDGNKLIIDRIEWHDNDASSITVVDQTLATVAAGSSGNAIALTAPTTVSCADTNSRTVTAIGAGITLKKGGVPIAVNGTFLATDVLTYDIAGSEPATTVHAIFSYTAAGACGNSNAANITANITAAVAGTITVVDQTLPPVIAGTNGVVVAFTAPTVNSCTDTGSRIFEDNGIGITVKKNNITLGQGDTFLATDVITYDIPNTVPTTIAYDIMRYRVVGSCGNSNIGIFKANVTAAGSNSATIVNETIANMASNSTGNALGVLTAPVISGSCAFAGVRRLTALSAGVTIKKNAIALTVGQTWAASDTITIDINVSITAQGGKELFRYVAVAACGDSNEAIISANITPPVVVTNSITIAGQTLASLVSGSTANILTALVTPVIVGTCAFAGVRRLTVLSAGVTIKKNTVAMIVGATWTSSDIITIDIASSITAQNLKEIFRYVAVGACGDSNEAIVLANITAAYVSGGGGGGYVVNVPAQVTAATATTSSMNWLIYLILAIVLGTIGFVVFLLFGAKRRKKKDNKSTKK